MKDSTKDNRPPKPLGPIEIEVRDGDIAKAYKRLMRECKRENVFLDIKDRERRRRK